MEYKPAEFAAKRAQAQRNAERHIAALLFGAAKAIVSLAMIYRTGLNDLSANQQFTTQAQRIVEETEAAVEAYINAYAMAAAKLLGIGSDGLAGFLGGDIFGKTLVERNRAYARTFADDIVKMCVAGVRMGYTYTQLLSAVRTGYRNPFASSVITKAQRKGIAIQTPAYGRGYYRSAYQNITRNAKATISLAWGRALKEYAGEQGHKYFTVHRGSSFPCDTCDYETTYVHRLDRDPMPPFHVNCVCYIEFTNKED